LWQAIDWEQLLDAYCSSSHSWIRSSAAAWRDHLGSSLPNVGSATAWNDLVDGEEFVIAMRARMSWVYSHISPPAAVEHDLVPSSAGVSWVLRMLADAVQPGYKIVVEVEERLGVRDFPKLAGQGTRPLGPSAKVLLLQHGVETSSGFDWDYLLAMWPLMSEARTDWVRASPRPKSHDRDNYRAMVEKGGPRHLGVGFGEAQTKITGECMFGARIQFTPDITLGELTVALEEIGLLVLAMAHLEPEQPSKAPSR